MKVVFYEGERIYFRPVEVEDEPLFRCWLNNPRNWRTLLRRRPLNKVEETKWLQTVHESPNDVVFGIVVRADDRLIGSAGLRRIDWVSRYAEFGIGIGDLEYQNKGYGTEATRLAVDYGFRILNLHRIELGVLSHNERGIRAYEKAGFVLEGRSRQAAYCEGRYVDILRYSILAPEWQGAGDKCPAVDEQ